MTEAKSQRHRELQPGCLLAPARRAVPAATIAA
jgi:hypothetical protein